MNRTQSSKITHSLEFHEPLVLKIILDLANQPVAQLEKAKLLKTSASKQIADILMHPDSHNQTDIAALLTARGLQERYGTQKAVRQMEQRAIHNQRYERANVMGTRYVRQNETAPQHANV